MHVAASSLSGYHCYFAGSFTKGGTENYVIQNKKIIKTQKAFYEAAFQNRRAELKGLKLEDGKIWKDAQLRHS
jgi:hypothetical protein